MKGKRPPIVTTTSRREKIQFQLCLKKYNSRKGRYPDMLGRDTSGYEMQTTTTTNNNFREKNQFFFNFASVIHIHIYI